MHLPSRSPGHWRRAFTPVELLVAIAIIASLGGVATFGDLSGRADTLNRKKWFTREYAGTPVRPQRPDFIGPNDAWYNPASRDGGF